MNVSSILSKDPDGMGFHYGNLPGDTRQINVRYEGPKLPGARFGAWVAYAGGIKIDLYGTKGEAEAAAIEWLKEHPEPVDVEA